MKVIRARHMGMCFGVRDALDVTRAVPRPDEVTIHGELVHNEEIVAELRQRGFRSTPEDRREGLPDTATVLVTAHGISDRERARLEGAGKRLLDTTCPLVRSAHEAVTAMREEGRFVVVIGRRDHVEVRGLIGDLEQFTVVASADEVSAWPHDRIGVICQTTTAVADARRIHRRIVELNPHADVRYVNTICRPTRLRQMAVEELLSRVDAVVVVGGRRSNNTRRLADRAAERGVPCLLVRTADDLDPDWCRQFAVVGLTAGTSTPASTVDAVHERLLAIAQARLTCA